MRLYSGAFARLQRYSRKQTDWNGGFDRLASSVLLRGSSWKWQRCASKGPWHFDMLRVPENGALILFSFSAFSRSLSREHANTLTRSHTHTLTRRYGSRG